MPPAPLPPPEPPPQPVGCQGDIVETTFAWISDLHIDRVDAYGEGELEAIFDQLNEIEPELTVNTGDVAQSHAPESYVTYKALIAGLNHPMYTIPGNHDDPYANYDASGLPRHFYAQQNDIAFVGIDTQEDGSGGGEISANELAYLEARLIEAESKSKVVFAHHPLFAKTQIMTVGRDELLALLTDYGVIAYLSGHRHARSGARIVDGVTHIDGGATSYGIGGTRMMYFERCEDDHLHMRNISARAPFATMADAQLVEIPL